MERLWLRPAVSLGVGCGCSKHCDQQASAINEINDVDGKQRRASCRDAVSLARTIDDTFRSGKVCLSMRLKHRRVLRLQ
ncbi:hypothetical protein BV25DRAFT_384644 [Artomyces pyxidatus]|uniref:Uncharacterized protein n=1 Tax=Artomyces pyxidatus TaxID=48021 RepID=A0ACB8T625_9AGAM|nr:hypothetical protein BV25DRAFT_384644 [Artomyces pyxidatus]